jgi:murein DD-endopeptidase MepM/ murein hydrolase activator NlpD
MAGGRKYPHTGSDYTVAFGEVYAPCDAEVIHTGWDNGNGHYIVLALGPPYDWDGIQGNAYMAFLHLSSINVTEKTRVKEGQKIGVSGDSGTNCRGPHLHLTLSNSDRAFVGEGAKVSPYDWIQARLKPITPPKPATVPPAPAPAPAPATPKPVPAPATPSKPTNPVKRITLKTRLQLERQRLEAAIRRAKKKNPVDAETLTNLQKRLDLTNAHIELLSQRVRKK